MLRFGAPCARRLTVGAITLAAAACAGAPAPTAHPGPTAATPAAVTTSLPPSPAVPPSATAAPVHYAIDVLALTGDGRLLGTDCHAARVLAIHGSGPEVIAGSGPGMFAAGFAGDGGSATNAQFRCPIGIVAKPDGNIVFTDHGNNRIRAIAPDGTIITIAGSGPTGGGTGSFSGDGGPATQATLSEPTFLLLDAEGNLYIADRDNNRIRVVAVDGSISTVAGNGADAFGGDGGPAIDASLDDPAGMALDSKGNLYIADSNNERIRVVGHDGSIRSFAGNGKLASEGDGRQALDASFADPEGIAFGPDGTLYVVEGEGNRIRAIARDGTVSTFAGTGVVGHAGDGGPAALATLSVGGSPGGIVFDAIGNLYIPDTGNRLIRMVDRNGIITKFAST